MLAMNATKIFGIRRLVAVGAQLLHPEIRLYVHEHLLAPVPEPVLLQDLFTGHPLAGHDRPEADLLILVLYLLLVLGKGLQDRLLSLFLMEFQIEVFPVVAEEEFLRRPDRVLE